MRTTRFGLFSAIPFAIAMAVSPAGAQDAQPAPAAPVAQAAAPEAPKGPAIENIIVTSRRREESIQDVPISMTAFTEELELPTIRDLSDLNGLSANVRIDGSPDRANSTSITIRGISPTRTDDNSLDSPIAVMIDGIFLGSLSGQLVENFDVDRVEILRGPQGTLYGRNTVGGVLNVVRSKPTGEFGAKLQYNFGSYDQQEFRAVFNAPIIDEKLAVKLFYTNLQRDGFKKNTFLGINQPQNDYQNFGLTVLANPTEWLEALLTVEKFDDKSQGGAFLTNWNLAPGVSPPPSDPNDTSFAGGFLACTGLPFFPFNLPAQTPCRTSLKIPNQIATDLPNPASSETWAETLNLTALLGDSMKFVSVTGYRNMTENRKQDFDGSSANFITLERNNKYHQFSQELRFEGNWEGRLGKLDLVVGGYYWDSYFKQQWITGGDFWTFVGGLSGYDLASNQWTALGVITGAAAANFPLLPVQACIARTPAGIATFQNVYCDAGANNLAGFGPGLVQRLYESQTTKSGAFFTHADWEFYPSLTLSAGVRYTSEKKDFRGAQAYLAPRSRERENAFPFYTNLDNKWTDVSPQAGLSWKATDDILAYVTYSEGWHSGGFFGVNQNVADFERDQYDPENSQSVEVGLKSQLFDNRLQTNVAYFHNTFKNKQEQAVVFDSTTQTVATTFSNVASAIYQGIEVEAQLAVTDGLDVFTSFGWLDASYSQFVTDVTPNPDPPGFVCPGIVPVGSVNTCIVDASYLTPRNAPKFTLGVGGSYTVPLGPGDVELATKYSWVSEVEGGLLNLESQRVGSRGDLQASVGYHWNDWRVSVFGRNLTDEIIEFPTPINPLFASGTVNIGRTWGIQLSADFGGK